MYFSLCIRVFFLSLCLLRFSSICSLYSHFLAKMASFLLFFAHPPSLQTMTFPPLLKFPPFLKLPQPCSAIHLWHWSDFPQAFGWFLNAVPGSQLPVMKLKPVGYRWQRADSLPINTAKKQLRHSPLGQAWSLQEQLWGLKGNEVPS